jgi:7-cyano-7-deazaguanine tRNA-ribosyltransferase
MLDIVAGLSLKNLKPPVWDCTSPYYLADLRAVMVSYADFHALRFRRRKAMELGLHRYLGIPRRVKIYLDNGAFCFMKREGEVPQEEYREFIEKAKPDWYPIPQDFIPTPRMRRKEQEACFTKTMAFNNAYDYDGFVPVMHISGFLANYTSAIKGNKKLAAKPSVALGGIVPNLLRTPKAVPLTDILASLRFARSEFEAKRLHVFGIGGTATIHIAALLRLNSIDSSGWRNRAARGLVQLLGSGDRMVANLGNWRGREPSRAEWKVLRACQCPACAISGAKGLKLGGVEGFCNRACHNLWVLLEEAKWIKNQLAEGSYVRQFRSRLDNSIYQPLIEYIVDTQGDSGTK